jgi:hypothetical protein
MDIQCIECELIHSINCEELNWDVVDVLEHGDNQMGGEPVHEAIWEITCNCGHDLSVTFKCWEYPIGAINMAEIIDKNNVKIIDEETCCPNIMEESE